MAHSNVASCVLSIVGSFSNGLDVFKKLREKRLRKKKPKKNDPVEGEELRLSRSLRQGQEDIGREYQNNVFAAGDHYAIGDAIAQTSLAEILLRLNTGLVGIIASFVNSDKSNVQLDYRSLTDISERSRVDTCRALRQLFRRMTQMRPQLSITAREHGQHGSRTDGNDSNSSSNRRRRKGSNGHTKVRGPMIARVVIADSTKPSQIAMVKPGDRRKKSTSSSSGSSALSKAPSESSTAATTPLPTPPPTYTPLELPRPVPQRSNTAPDVPKPRRKHSTGNVAALRQYRDDSVMRAAKSTPQLESTLPPAMEPLPPMPNSAPLPYAESPPILPRRRKPTPTYYSIASDSTKIGEIPMHKWATPYDFDQMSMMNKQAYESGWPQNQLGGANKKKRFGFSRLFGGKSA